MHTQLFLIILQTFIPEQHIANFLRTGHIPANSYKQKLAESYGITMI